MNTPQRVARYYQRLQEFWAMQGIVSRPGYNADKDPGPWKVHEELSAWLRAEADELFCLGVSVYH